MFRRAQACLHDFVGLPHPVQTDLLNDRMGDCFRACQLGRAAVVSNGVVLFTARGELRDDAAKPPEGVEFRRTAFLVEFSAFSFDGEGYADLESIVSNYDLEGDGAFVWIIPDGYMAGLSEVEKVWESEGGGYFSHESMCVLNTSERATWCRLEAFFEDTARAPIAVDFEVAAKQSLHYRLDKLTNDDGSPFIPKDMPVSYKITSYDRRVVVQGSRILTSGRGSEFGSFGTAMAWTPVA